MLLAEMPQNQAPKTSGHPILFEAVLALKWGLHLIVRVETQFNVQTNVMHPNP